MRVPLDWLRDYVEIDLEPEELARLLTLAGLEVDNIDYPDQGLDNVVTGEIKEISPHPDAEHLLVCQVDAGPAGRVQVVTGAPNVRSGQKVVLALPGAQLPGGAQIHPARFRGVASDGMLCSAPELGLGGRQEDGIMELPAGTRVGIGAAEALGLAGAVLELEVTPNRADCLGLINLAREVAALTGRKVALPAIDLPPGREKAADCIRVTIAEPELCRRYVAKIVKGVKVGPSPGWMQRRLEVAGMRAVNNIVDITNYVMLETGQPLHAFDCRAIAGGEIRVRPARAGERIVTLDGVERELDPKMLVIADAERAVAVAGVMGGEATEITSDTDMVLLESACFAGPSVRRTARQLGLASEASLRFSRGVDPQGAAWAADRACQLMAELAGGEALGGSVDEYPRPWSPITVVVRPSRVNELLGLAIDTATMEEIWQRLGLEYSREPGGPYRVVPPSWRPDLSLEVDLVEEIGRLYGYDKIPPAFPPGVTGQSKTTPEQELEEDARNILAACGLEEVVTFSFMGRQLLETFHLPDAHPWWQAVEIQNPLREEHRFMRTNLLGGVLEVARHNAAHQQVNMALFEVARIFRTRPCEELPREALAAAALASGELARGWNWGACPFDFFYLKGVLEEWFSRWHLEPLFVPGRAWPFLHPGRGAAVLVNGREAGFIGELHPEVQEALDLPLRTVVFHVDLDVLLNLVRPSRYQGWSPFPAAERDLSVILPEDVPASRVGEAIRQAGGAELESCSLFDVYQGSQVPEGHRSLAFHLVYRSHQGTLVENEVNELESRIVQALHEMGGAVRRG